MRAGSTLATGGPGDGVTRAAVRVLGADLLLPPTLLRRDPAPAHLPVLQAAVPAPPPPPDAAPTAWSSHCATTRAP
ncbi:hypothetical protein N6Q81_30865, partial [Streptomyces vinaceusdrappus]